MMLLSLKVHESWVSNIVVDPRGFGKSDLLDQLRKDAVFAPADKDHKKRSIVGYYLIGRVMGEVNTLQSRRMVLNVG